MTLNREQLLAEMGITPLWVLRDDPESGTGDDAEDRQVQAVASDAMSTDRAMPSAPDGLAGAGRIESTPPEMPAEGADWPALTQAILDCRACPLCQQRRQAVPGVGDLRPDWLFVGEGPGAEEDARGEPFVGQAGKLLDAMLASLELARGNKVYIANAVKCRPPGNRTPEASEMAACRPFLERQIALLQPKIIVLLGKAAVHSVLGEDKSLSSLRLKRFAYQGIPVVVTYHPAYLLRNLPDKAKAWEDLLFARRVLRGSPAA